MYVYICDHACHVSASSRGTFSEYAVNCDQASVSPRPWPIAYTSICGCQLYLPTQAPFRRNWPRKQRDS